VTHVVQTASVLASCMLDGDSLLYCMHAQCMPQHNQLS
jgi:hypothetical protein